MSAILVTQTEKYIESILPRRDAVLRQMEAYAARNKVPIVGPACARVIYQVARMIRARRIFELGSAIGYSTLWLARAVGPKGRVFYTDTEPANAKRAEAYLRRAGVLDRVTILVGEASQMFQQTSGQFDLIFNDVFKTQYPDIFKLALPRLRPGGAFITDNVLWYGKVGRPVKRNDAETAAVLEFNRLVYNSRQLFTTIVPLRDGLAVCLKEE